MKKNNNQRFPEWKSGGSIISGPRDHYGRFWLYNLKPGQGITIGVLTRRILLGELEEPAIIFVDFKEIHIPGILHSNLQNLHDFNTILGVRQNVFNICLNLKQVVLKKKRNSRGSWKTKAKIFIEKMGDVTARDIIIEGGGISVVDPDQFLFTVTRPLTLSIDLGISIPSENSELYAIKNPGKGFFPIKFPIFPIRNAHFSVTKDGGEECLFLEIWTNGSLTAPEALYLAGQKVLEFYQFFPANLPHPPDPILCYDNKFAVFPNPIENFKNLEDFRNPAPATLDEFELELRQKILAKLSRVNINVACDLRNEPLLKIVERLEKMKLISEISRENILHSFTNLMRQINNLTLEFPEDERDSESETFQL